MSTLHIKDQSEHTFDKKQMIQMNECIKRVFEYQVNVDLKKKKKHRRE